ncbi:MAG: class I SAM-dependent methyltransferase [Anaerolineales bacterium]
MELSEYDNIARLEATHWWYVGMRNIARTILSHLPLPPNAAILDAGCGVGGGLKWLNEFGSPVGVDVHPRAVHYAARVSPRVARASVSTFPFPAASFDLVTSFEVLYHLAVSDDVAALRECARVLRPGGWLLLRVPAHDWLRGAHDRQVHTRHRYGKAELRQKLEAANFAVRCLTYVGAALFAPAVVRRLIQRADDAHSDVVLPAPIVNRALTAFLSIESCWLKLSDVPVGLSLLAMAQAQS